MLPYQMLPTIWHARYEQSTNQRAIQQICTNQQIIDYTYIILPRLCEEPCSSVTLPGLLYERNQISNQAPITTYNN